MRRVTLVLSSFCVARGCLPAAPGAASRSTVTLGLTVPLQQCDEPMAGQSPHQGVRRDDALHADGVALQRDRDLVAWFETDAFPNGLGDDDLSLAAHAVSPTGKYGLLGKGVGNTSRGKGEW